MYFRPGSNVTDLSLHKDGRIDCFEGFDRFFRLPYVLLEWQRGKIEDDSIKTGAGCFYGLRQRMGMIRVKKNRAVGFLPQTLSSFSEANTAFNSTQSPTLIWPIATPSF